MLSGECDLFTAAWVCCLLSCLTPCVMATCGVLVGLMVASNVVCNVVRRRVYEFEGNSDGGERCAQPK